MYKPKNKWIITFEGSSDCTGKTTLIKALLEELKPTSGKIKVGVNLISLLNNST